VHRFSGSGYASAIVMLQKRLHFVLCKGFSIGRLAFAKLIALNHLIGSGFRHLLGIVGFPAPERRNIRSADDRHQAKCPDQQGQDHQDPGHEGGTRLLLIPRASREQVEEQPGFAEMSLRWAGYNALSSATS